PSHGPLPIPDSLYQTAPPSSPRSVGPWSHRLDCRKKSHNLTASHLASPLRQYSPAHSQGDDRDCSHAGRSLDRLPLRNRCSSYHRATDRNRDQKVLPTASPRATRPFLSVASSG